MKVLARKSFAFVACTSWLGTWVSSLCLSLALTIQTCIEHKPACGGASSSICVSLGLQGISAEAEVLLLLASLMVFPAFSCATLQSGWGA